jgi:hypothetical protein
MRAEAKALPLSLRERFAVLLFVFASGQAAKRQIDADEPQVVSHTKRSRHLLRMVTPFAADGRMDSAAVEALRSVAGRRDKDLRRAAASVRMGGGVDENRFRYVANQLLLAAATGQPPRPITVEHEALLQRIEWLLQGKGDSVYARLVVLQPALADVAHAMEQAVEAAMGEPTDESRLAAAEQSRDLLANLLRPLVGPEADTDDSLLRTRAAYSFAAAHLSPVLMIESRQRDWHP